MIRVGFGRSLLGVGLAAVFLVGCGGTQTAMNGAVPQGMTAESQAHRASGSSGDLIYADDEGGSIVVATYPDMKTVTHFEVPRIGSSDALTFGICSDKSGNVFITADYFVPYAGNIYEYSHGATSPSATLSVASFYQAYDCAYDPTTGNLAVADYCHGCGTGSVSIFANEQGQPTVYIVPSMGFPEYVGYDNNGNLFASGLNTKTGAYVFAELPKGSSTFTDISLPYGVCCLGRIQWDGKYITMQNERQYIVYRLSVSGSSGSIVGTTSLNDVTKIGMGESWLDAKHSRLVVPEGHFRRVLGAYAYPGGGNAVKVDAHAHLVLMLSATISVGN
jgi:hypothetical protein